MCLMNPLTQRETDLLKIITKHSPITVRELTSQFALSRETIRKELITLENLQLIERQNGKVSYIATAENGKLIQSYGILSKPQRRERILKLLEHEKEVRISTLSQKLRVSMITIRNDISALEMEGLVIRKHGAVRLFESSFDTYPKDKRSPFTSKIKILGQHTILHINPGETIFLDGGEVAQYVAKNLPPFSNIPIVTNSLKILELLKERNYAYPVHICGTHADLSSGLFRIGRDQTILPFGKIQKAFICCFSYSNNRFYLHEQEDSGTIELLCTVSEKIYIILESRFMDVHGNRPLEIRKFRDKIQEVLIDDGVGTFRASVQFSPQIPLVLCGNNYTYKNVKKQQYRIGFLVNKDRNYFVQAVHNSLLESAATSNSVSLIIRECEGDYNSTITNLNILLEEGVDLIIDYSLCMESLMYVGDRCLSRKVKLISVDYLAPGAIYFGADNALAGKIAGNKAVSFIENNWNSRVDHLVVLGKYGHEPITRLRISSALEHIEHRLNVKKNAIHSIDWGKSDVNPTQQLIHLMKSIPKDDKMLIMAFNLRQLLASYKLILEHRDIKNTIIVGQNYTKQIEELLKQGESPLLGCVHYNPENYGSQILDLALRMLQNIEVDARNYTELTWIDKSKTRENNPEILD